MKIRAVSLSQLVEIYTDRYGRKTSHLNLAANRWVYSRAEHEDGIRADAQRRIGALRAEISRLENTIEQLPSLDDQEVYFRFDKLNANQRRISVQLE